MAIAWAGADPVEVGDGSSYELGTEWLINETVTITHLRVHAGAGAAVGANRRARLWNAAGVELAVATLPDTLPVGWSEHELNTPVTRTAGQRVVSSYSTFGNYSALAAGLAADVPSADTAVTALASANATNGNGVFAAGSPGTFPTTGSGGSAFYGITFTYSLGAGGNTAPEVTQLTAVPAGAVVTATAVVADQETLVGASYRISWGDGTPDTTGALTAQHTYAESGAYAVLFRVTDAGGLVGTRATAVLVSVPNPDVHLLDLDGVINALVSHAMATGLFERVNEHELVHAPARGLTAAVWVDGIAPVQRVSGLSVSSARLAMKVRIYHLAEVANLDAIDPAVTTSTNALITAYSADFDLGGDGRWVDLLGAHGISLSAQAGYVRIDGTPHRVMDLTVPVILTDVWEQIR
jgi:hypothetical protein